MVMRDILASLLAAALSGLGVGSGGLLVIYLTLVAGIDQHTAQGINLLFFLFSGGAALAVHSGGRRLYPAAIALMTGAGVVGAFLGTSWAQALPPLLLRRLFGGMLVLSGMLALYRTLHPRTRGRMGQIRQRNFSAEK